MTYDRAVPAPDNAFQISHAELLIESYRTLLKRNLVHPASSLDIGRALYEAPIVVLAHDTVADPVFFYGNLAAQQLFEVDWEELVRLPSRFSAEPVAQEVDSSFPPLDLIGLGKRFLILIVSRFGRRRTANTTPPALATPRGSHLDSILTHALQEQINSADGDDQENDGNDDSGHDGSRNVGRMDSD